MKKILVLALALLMLFSLIGCAYDTGMTNSPSVSDAPMSDPSDGMVKDNDGYIGNENASDPAGDTVPENTMPETAMPGTTTPDASAPGGTTAPGGSMTSGESTSPNTSAPGTMAPEQSANPKK